MTSPNINKVQLGKINAQLDSRSSSEISINLAGRENYSRKNGNSEERKASVEQN